VKEWKSGKEKEWKSGKVEEWKCGRVEMWKGGNVERWKCGKVKRWKHVALESGIPKRSGSFVKNIGETHRKQFPDSPAVMDE